MYFKKMRKDKILLRVNVVKREGFGVQIRDVKLENNRLKKTICICVPHKH